MDTAQSPTVLKLTIFCIFLSAELSTGNNVCPTSSTGSYPVVHMCTDECVSQVKAFFIDAFAPASTATTCNCTLKATSYVQIASSMIITTSVVHMCTDESVSQVNEFFIDAFAPASTATTCNCTLKATSYVQIASSAIISTSAPCDSEISVNTESIVKYACGNVIVNTSSNVGTGDISIILNTKISNKNAIYCLSVVKNFGEGTLSLQCFSPFDVATTATSSTETTTSKTSSTNTEPNATSEETTPFSSTAETTQIRTSTTSFTTNTETIAVSNKTASVSSTVDTTETKTMTSLETNKPESQQCSDSDSFPVAAAVVIGAVGVLVIEAVIAGSVIIYRRTRKIKTRTSNTGHTRQNVDGNASLSSLDDDVGNNYDQLQHTNSSSGVDQEHVYLHVVGEYVEKTPYTTEQYVNMETGTQ